MPTVKLEVSEQQAKTFELPSRVVIAKIQGTACEPWFVIRNKYGNAHVLNGRDLAGAKILKS